MSIQSLISLIAAVIYASLLVSILFNRPWQQQHRLFIWYLVAIIFWTLSNLFFYYSYFLVEYKLLIFRILILTSMWWGVQLYRFARAFLALPCGWGVWFGYISMAVLAIASIMGYAPPGLITSDGMSSPIYGWWFVLYAVPLATLAVVGVYSLIKRVRILTDPRERNKVSYLIVAVILLAGFGFISISPIMSGGYPLVHIGSLLSACILTYAVMKHDLVSINAVLRAVLGWTSLAIVGVFLYAGVFYSLHLIFGFKVNFVVLALATTASFVSALIIYWLRPVFLGMVAQLFYRGTYSYRQELLRFNARMSSIINLNELADEMLPIIVKALHSLQAKLLFKDIGSGEFITRFTYTLSRGKFSDDLRLDSDNPIITWLEKENGPLNVRQIDSISQFKGLWQEEKERITASSLALLCPIKSRGELIGVLALDEKKSGTLYSQEDIEMLISMTGEAGIIIENARMFDTLKKQQYQVQQLLSEVIDAQESERQRISVDLHDSVAQWLAGASYQAQVVESLLLKRDNDEAMDELTLVEDTVAKSLKELRRVLIDLRPPALDELGLTHALRKSLEDLASNELTCDFSEEGEQPRLPPSVEITVYRVVQEALSNIRKHANATRVELSLLFLGDILRVKIRDNGVGFDFTRTIDTAISVGHLGLLGMKQRVEMLGGALDIKTRHGSGTTITMDLPIEQIKQEVEES